MTFAERASHSALTDADLRFIAESIPHIVWMTGPAGRTEYLNEEGETYTGHRLTDPDEEWSWAELMHRDDVSRAMSAWEQAARTTSPYQVDYRLLRSDGQYRWHAFRCRPICDEHGAVVKWIGTGTDIDDAKQAAADLLVAQRETAETLTLLETLLSNAPFGFGFVDRDLRLVRLNETLAAINGSTAAEQIGGQRVAEVVPEPCGLSSNRSLRRCPRHRCGPPRRRGRRCAAGPEPARTAAGRRATTRCGSGPRSSGSGSSSSTSPSAG